MKPTIWWDKETQEWCCADLWLNSDDFPEGSEEYCKCVAFGSGKSVDRAYKSWLEDVEDSHKRYQGRP